MRIQVFDTESGRDGLGRVPDGFKTEDLKGDAVAPFVEEAASGFGPLRAVSHSAVMSKTPAYWARPAMPLGSHPPQWPARLSKI